MTPAASERNAHAKTEIVFFDRPAGEGLRERRMGLVGFRNQQNTGGVLVKPVHDARPLRSATLRKDFSQVIKKRVNQRAGTVAVSGMDDKTRRFVYGKK